MKALLFGIIVLLVAFGSGFLKNKEFRSWKTAVPALVVINICQDFLI